MEIEEKYMLRALQLAKNGELDASPNPMVGAVIVNPDGIIIGEGWHRRCGEGHAEVNAVASVKDESAFKDATMYVTLEPCSHYGKTPPCAELIIKMGIPKVVVGSLDPFEKVSGRGVKMLREAGVEVVTGVLEKECRILNRRFMTAHKLRRPFITLKWAQSSNGYIDGKISTRLTSAITHKLRAVNDAILVGSGTVIADNPSLNTRNFAGKTPVIVALDRRGRIQKNMNIFKGEARVIILNGSESLLDKMTELYRMGITSVLVEGGAMVHQSFIDEGLWDEIRVEIGVSEINGRIKAPTLLCQANITEYEEIDGNKIIKYSSL
ncbi:MAG: bifunctional diaminohydroxyphosphoribosylaminopyrimidine deaminase/5-amino-6-(5-phosphoribosylamino)uracil reductase RibD [Muribaculum sp.]|nr:bifunctional diaminohydroxyphosphoribosylaminopyrimidine deaminase/5-amino-6-(5-phosphoribosylamino)uracil reductase RibD [Muribaculum sp.]